MNSEKHGLREGSNRSEVGCYRHFRSTIGGQSSIEIDWVGVASSASRGQSYPASISVCSEPRLCWISGFGFRILCGQGGEILRVSGWSFVRRADLIPATWIVLSETRTKTP